MASHEPQIQATVKSDKVKQDAFNQILEELVHFDWFGQKHHSSLFIVYAHDNHNETVAHASCVRNLIEWFKTIQANLLSDRSPLLPQRNQDDCSDDTAAHNIVSNQLRLISTPIGSHDRPKGIVGVDKVIVCISPLLEQYYTHSFAAPYLDLIQRAYSPQDKAQKCIRLAVDEHCQEPNFHHVLTEIALLRLRHEDNPDDHGIIPLILGSSSTTCLEFLSNADLRVSAKTDPASLRALFFKLLKRIYPRIQWQIEHIEQCYQKVCQLLQDQPLLNVSTLLDKELYTTRQILANGQRSEIRQISATVNAQKVDVHCQGARKYHTPMCIVPFTKNMDFVGRDSILEHVGNKLFGRYLDSVRWVALTGLGGVGKTQVALQTAFQAQKQRPNWSVIWVPAMSKEAFEQACADMVRLLGSESAADQEDPKRLMRAYLEDPAFGHWLLIVDNADDEEVIFGEKHKPGGIRDFLPTANHGRILFTTRSRKIAVRLCQSQIVEMAEMNKHESRELLSNALVHKHMLNNDDNVEKLLETLTYLPLAITQAAAFLNSEGESIAEYIRLLENTEQTMVELLSIEFEDDTRQGTRHAVASTWTVSFEHIREHYPNAAELLLFMAHVESKSIPRSILPDVGGEVRMTQAIGTLRGYSFLSEREESKLYDMHRLVQVASRAWLAKRKDAEQRRLTALRHLQKKFWTDTWRYRETWRLYLPHVMKAIQAKKGEEWARDECALAYWAGRCLDAEGRTREAISLLEHVVAFDKTTRAESAEHLLSQVSLARMYTWEGRAQEAILLLEHVVTIHEKTLPESDPYRLTSQWELASVYETNGRVKEAIPLLEHVVRVQAQTLDQSDPVLLTTQYTLGYAYHSDGRIQDALSLLGDVIAISKKTLAESDPLRLLSQYRLAKVYQAEGKIKEAICLLEYVMTVQEKTLAGYHQQLLMTQYDLARFYQEDGQGTKASLLLEKVVTNQEAAFAQSHPFRLMTQAELAKAYQASGRISDAIDLLEHVVAIQEETQPESNFARLHSQYSLAYAYKADSKRIKDAVTLLEHIVAVCEKSLSQTDRFRLISQHALAGAYEADGQRDKAISLLTHGVDTCKRLLPGEHFDRQVFQHELERVAAAAAAQETTPPGPRAFRLALRRLSTFTRHKHT